jgi:hypothetical protein
MKRGSRTTRALAAGALLVALALPMTGAPAAQACTINSDSCTAEFAHLRSDIGAYVPANQAASMLSRLNKVDSSGDPYNPGDLDRNAILNGVRSNVVGLGKAGQVSAAGVQAITADIDTILPPNPI